MKGRRKVQVKNMLKPEAKEKTPQNLRRQKRLQKGEI
jgi:hypothetical protein